jgi:regulator of cell morphogenesis and NO signaling
MPVLDSSLTLGQLIAEKPARTRVLERFGISYCCRGEVPVTEACAESGASLHDLEAALADLEAPSTDERDWSDAPLDELIDVINATHHVYMRTEMPRLNAMLDKLAEKRGDEYPWLRDARSVFVGLRQEIEMHLVKEEQILFPMIRQLLAGQAGAATHCGSVRNPIFVMEREHTSAKQALARLRSLTNDYTPPEGACGTFRAAIDGLAEMEADLLEHIHKEDDNLFPRAADLEATLLAA